MAKLSVEQALAKAKSHKKRGEVVEAKTLYATILKAFPNNKKAQKGLTALGDARPLNAKQSPPETTINDLANLFNKGQLDAVVQQCEILVRHYSNSFLVWSFMGGAYLGLGEASKAVNAFFRVTQLNPKYPEGHNNLGSALQSLNKYDESIKYFENALKLKSDYSDAHYNIGISYKELNRYDLAIKSYKNALELSPKNWQAYGNMGLALKEKGDWVKAIVAYENAIKINPNDPELLSNMGNVFKVQGKLEEAIEAYNKALAIKPDYAEAYSNMGITLQDQGKLEEAIEAYNKALAIMPNYATAYNNMGNALKEQGKLEEAIEAYNKALAIKPDYAEAHSNMGNTLKEQGKLEEAIEAYNKALVIKPDYAEAYSNMSFAKLLTSSWREGIELRKWRWHTKKHQTYNRSFSAREWDGNEAAHDKTLLVWAEQGPGDVVIWASCISHYAKICGKIIIECHPKLVELFKRSFPNVMIRSADSRSVDSPEDFDFQVPMETLFGYACLEGACTETQSSYLFPDPKRVKHWSTKLRNISSLKTVGLSWKSPIMTTQRAKNYPELSHWGKTLQKYKSKFIFVNLQSTDYRDDITYFKDHFGCEIVHFDQLDLYNDLSDVAALSQALDCSISVATAAATISAAVGTQTIIPTWKQSSWNNILFNSRGPAVEILLKNTSASWTPVFEEVATKLKVLDAEC
ncbi:tetratricopeptide repeat protein [Planktomarina temperata]|nr:tetratricopeptide repeat protein [Planktomarina temperata]